jgi:acetoin:2,6-dichlorophenolindophenol oxidoreductase subunit beta
MSQKKYAVAIRDVLAEEMRRDEEIFVMGEDVAEQGGIFGCTRGLIDEFGPERVRDTPISEQAFIGMGIGASLTGMRPVVELMYMDFTLVSMDQILNQAAKLRYMYGGAATLPLVIRGQQGVGRGNAATHSQSLEMFFMHFPGIKVALPSTASDAAGLLRTAIRDDNPVIIFEHKALYVTSEDVSDDPNYAVPFGKAAIRREGKDVTIVATLEMVHKALDAAEKLAEQRIEAEIVDPRTLVPLDEKTILDSVVKTGRAVCVHEAHRTGGMGAEIASIIQEKAFKYLDAPVLRLGAKQCPLPFNLGLENAVVPQVSDIIEAAKQVCYKG